MTDQEKLAVFMAMEPGRHSNDAIRVAKLMEYGIRCQYCWHTFPHTVYLECEHIISKKEGGLYTAENITLSCKPCNGHKYRNKTPEQVRGRNVKLGYAAEDHPAEWNAFIPLGADKGSPAHRKLEKLLASGVEPKCAACDWAPPNIYQLTIYDEGKGHESWKGPLGTGLVLCHHCRGERIVWSKRTLEDMQNEILPHRKIAQGWRMWNQ